MNGILLIDKEQTWTSNDVVSKLKGILHERRVGHSGTLDPMATGLLEVFVGRATRAVEFAEGHDKRYIAALRLGTVTDTQDIWGRVLETREHRVAERELDSALSRFIGRTEQIPPMYSAVRVNGQRLYDIARRGGEVERRPRPISIERIDVIGRDGDDFLLDICCSKGTYIRTLCSDVGAALGCGGCMSSLRRISVGGYSVDDALTIAQVQALADTGSIGSALLPVDGMFAGYAECIADAQAERLLRCGTAYKTETPDGEYRVYSQSGEFLMLGRAKCGEMQTIKSFFEV